MPSMRCSPGCWAKMLLPSGTSGKCSSRTTTWSGTHGSGPSAVPSPEVAGGHPLAPPWLCWQAGVTPRPGCACPLHRGGAGAAAPWQASFPQPHSTAQTPRQEESP